MVAKPRILVLYAHPASYRSRLNRLLTEAARTVPNVVLHDLYDAYPDFHIDVSHEQTLLAYWNLAGPMATVAAGFAAKIVG
jgi:putative NADPH-quinone reductase